MTLKRHPIAASARHDLLTRLPIDHGLAARLATTHARVRDHDRRFAEIFYARLFDAAPHLRGLFPRDIDAQAQKLTAALDMVVRNLAAPESNAVMLRELGRRHAAYGARPEHYALVTELLVASMRDLLGEAVSAGALEEWRRAFELIGAQMREGAASAVPAAGAPAASAAPAAAPRPRATERNGTS